MTIVDKKYLVFFYWHRTKVWPLFVNLELIKFGVLNCFNHADVKEYDEFKTNHIPPRLTKLKENYSRDDDNVRTSTSGK